MATDDGHGDETHDELVQRARDLVERAKGGDMGAAREVFLHALGPPHAPDVKPEAFGDRIMRKLDAMGARPTTEELAKFDARCDAQFQFARTGGNRLEELAEVVERIVEARGGDPEYTHYAALLRAGRAGDAALIEEHARWLIEHGTELKLEGQVALAVIRDGRDQIGDAHGLSDS